MATEYDPQYALFPWTVDCDWCLKVLIADGQSGTALRHLHTITSLAYTAAYQSSKNKKKGHAFKFKTNKGLWIVDPDEYMSFPAEADPDLTRINPWMDSAMADADTPLSNKCSTYYTYLLFHARPSTERKHRHTPHTTLPTTDAVKKLIKNFKKYGTNEALSAKQKTAAKKSLEQKEQQPTPPSTPSDVAVSSKATALRANSTSSLGGTMLASSTPIPFPALSMTEAPSGSDSSSAPSSPETSIVDSDEDMDEKELKSLRKSAKERKREKKRVWKKKRKAKEKLAKQAKKQRSAATPVASGRVDAAQAGRKDIVIYGSPGKHSVIK